MHNQMHTKNRTLYYENSGANYRDQSHHKVNAVICKCFSIQGLRKINKLLTDAKRSNEFVSNTKVQLTTHNNSASITQYQWKNIKIVVNFKATETNCSSLQ